MTREVEIVPYRDGPYLVRGPFSLRDQNGVEIRTARRTISLCRCGKSRTRPFCDGTHQLVKFRATSEAEAPLARPAPIDLDAPAVNGNGRATRRAVGRSPAPAPAGGLHGSRVVLAAATLRAALDQLRRMAHLTTGPETQAEMVRAAVLLEAAERSLTNAMQSAAVCDRLAPCVCLVRGALSVVGAEPRGAKRVVIGQLESLLDQLAQIADAP